MCCIIKYNLIWIIYIKLKKYWETYECVYYYSYVLGQVYKIICDTLNVDICKISNIFIMS